MDVDARTVARLVLPPVDGDHLLYVLHLGRGVYRRPYLFADLDEALARAERVSASASGNAYWGVATRGPRSPCGPACRPDPGCRHLAKVHCSTTASLHADVDDKCFAGGHAAARAAIDAFELPPTVLVDSGGGYHCYWRLRELLDLAAPGSTAAAEGAMRGIHRALGATAGTRLDAVQDLSRVLRVPGTYNRKDGRPPRPVRVVAYDPDRRYDIGELALRYAVPTVATAAGPAPPPPTDGPLSAWRPGHEAALARAVASGVSGRVVHAIRTGRGYSSDRSRRDQSVVLALRARGVAADDVLAIFSSCAVGGGARRRGAHGATYVRRTIARADAYLAAGTRVRAARPPLPPEVAETLARRRAAKAIARIRPLLPATVPELRRALGWSRTTVEKHVARGVATGEFEAAGARRGPRGGPASVYRVRTTPARGSLGTHAARATTDTCPVAITQQGGCCWVFRAEGAG